MIDPGVILLVLGMAGAAAAREAFGPPQSAHPFAPRPGAVGPPMPAAIAVPPSPPGCAERLRALGARFEVVAAPKADPACAIVEPLRLASVPVAHKGGDHVVTLSGAPLLACETALAVAGWVRESVAPLARGHFDEPLLELGVGGGFECRQRNHQSGAPRSEHSYGRALDVMSFRTPTRNVRVEASGPPGAQPFIEAVWSSACGRFSTALGPRSDPYHATHIHVDMQPRRSPSSRFCE